MTCRILVVEDEIFVAIEIEHVVTELGHVAVGIAADAQEAETMGRDADIALVDLNLRDGFTGDRIGRNLAEKFGVTVLFMTANPDQLGKGIPGTLGVIPKPVTEEDMRQAVKYAVARRNNCEEGAPKTMRHFS